MFRCAIGYLILLNLLALCHTTEQTTTESKTFEVASVKPSLPLGPGGGSSGCH
jgi:hypothetical protein